MLSWASWVVWKAQRGALVSPRWGFDCALDSVPGAHAPGYCMSPLCGCGSSRITLGSQRDPAAETTCQYVLAGLFDTPHRVCQTTRSRGRWAWRMVRGATFCTCKRSEFGAPTTRCRCCEATGGVSWRLRDASTTPLVPAGPRQQVVWATQIGPSFPLLLDGARHDDTFGLLR
jgi:hypothetical protein